MILYLNNNYKIDHNKFKIKHQINKEVLNLNNNFKNNNNKFKINKVGLNLNNNFFFKYLFLKSIIQYLSLFNQLIFDVILYFLLF